MPLLTSLGIIDVFALTHSLYARQKKLGPPNNRVRYLAIDEEVLADWQILKTFLNKVSRTIEQRNLPLNIVDSGFRWLDPGGLTPWAQGTEGEIEAHIGVVTHPYSRLYVGPEVYSLGWGEVVLTAASPSIKCSAVNSSDLRTVSLVLTLTQAAQVEAREAAC